MVVLRANARRLRTDLDGERRNAAAYLLTKADAYPDGSSDWVALADAAQSIAKGEHAKNAAYGSFTDDVYARVDAFLAGRMAK